MMMRMWKDDDKAEIIRTVIWWLISVGLQERVQERHLSNVNNNNNNKQVSTKQLSCSALPHVLCFHLKRFEQTVAYKRASHKIDNPMYAKAL